MAEYLGEDEANSEDKQHFISNASEYSASFLAHSVILDPKSRSSYVQSIGNLDG